MKNCFSVHCEEVSCEVWEEKEYHFTKNANLAKCDFESIAKILVGWDEEIEMEIKFHYITNTFVMVEVRTRIK